MRDDGRSIARADSVTFDVIGMGCALDVPLISNG
jgi:hypothetical protein